MERNGLTGFELLVLVVGGIAAVLVGVVWAGASLALLATGEVALPELHGAAEALGRLPLRAGDPAAAWPAPTARLLPGPVVYWTCTMLVTVAAAVVLGIGVRWFGGSRVGTSKRRPLSTPVRGSLAAGTSPRCW